MNINILLLMFHTCLEDFTSPEPLHRKVDSLFKSELFKIYPFSINLSVIKIKQSGLYYKLK